MQEKNGKNRLQGRGKGQTGLKLDHRLCYLFGSRCLPSSLSGRGSPLSASRRRSKGFTLIEILISLVIVSVGLIGIMALLSHSLKEAGEIVEDTFASTTARSVYEALREGARNRSF